MFTHYLLSNLNPSPQRSTKVHKGLQRSTRSTKVHKGHQKTLPPKSRLPKHPKRLQQTEQLGWSGTCSDPSCPSPSRSPDDSARRYCRRSSWAPPARHKANTDPRSWHVVANILNILKHNNVLEMVCLP